MIKIAVEKVMESKKALEPHKNTIKEFYFLVHPEKFGSIQDSKESMFFYNLINRIITNSKPIKINILAHKGIIKYLDFPKNNNDDAFLSFFEEIGWEQIKLEITMDNEKYYLNGYDGFEFIFSSTDRHTIEKLFNIAKELE